MEGLEDSPIKLAFKHFGVPVDAPDKSIPMSTYDRINDWLAGYKAAKALSDSQEWVRLDRSHYNMLEGFMGGCKYNMELSAKEATNRIFEYILGVKPELLPQPPKP